MGLVHRQSSILDCHVCKAARKDTLTRKHIVYLLYGWCTHTRYHTCPNTFEPKIAEHLASVSALWHGSLGRGVLRPCVAHTGAQARSHTTEASAAWLFWQIMIQTNNKVIEMCAMCFWVLFMFSCSSHIINWLWLINKSAELSIPKYPVDGHVAQYPIAAFIYLIHTFL